MGYYLTDDHVRCANSGGFSCPPVEVSFLPLTKTKEKLDGRPIFQSQTYWFFSCREELIRQIGFADALVGNMAVLISYYRCISENTIATIRHHGGIISGGAGRAVDGAMSGLRVINYLEQEAGWSKSRVYLVKNIKFSQLSQVSIDTAQKNMPGLYSMNFYVLDLGKKWISNPYLLSLALLIMRFLTKLKAYCAERFIQVDTPGFQNYNEFDTFMSQLAVSRMTDSDYVRKTYRYWLPILVYYDELFSKLPNLYSQNSAAGISTLIESRKDRSHLAKASFEKLRYKLIRYHYTKLGKEITDEQIQTACGITRDTNQAELFTTC